MTYELQWYEIDVPNIHIKDENINNAGGNNVRAINVIFADRLGIASHLQKSITSHSQLLQYSDAKCSAINVHLQNLQRFIKNARHVFYLWGISDWQNKTSSEDVFESLNSVCISLKHIVKFLAQNSATCKLIIVTLGSQSMSMISKEGDYKTEMSLHCGLTGAPLWGMVRSLLRESTYDNTVLVDLSKGTAEEVSTMVALVCGSHSPYHSEYTIFGSRIYTNKLTKVSLNRDFPNMRAVWAQPESPLSVISTYPERLERLELHYEAQDKCSYPVKSVSVNVLKARLHDREFFYVTEAGVTMIKSDPWSDRNKDGYRVMIIDCIGKVLSSESCTRKHTKVHTCYPMKLSSICNVPESLLVKSSDLPKWMQNSPCLSVFVLLWEVLIRNIHEYSNEKLVIEGTKKYQNLSKLLSHVASICGFEKGSYNWQDEYEPTATDMQSVLFLYLGPITLTVSQRILKSLPTRSVLVNVFHGVDTAIHSISIVRPDIEVVSINNNHIFQARHLERTLPEVVKWINEISLKSSFDALTFSEFNFEQSATSTVVPSCDDESFKVLVMDPKSFVHADKDRLFHKHSCYLVVGGTKGLGLEICKYISERGGGYIAVLSRSPPSESPELSHLQSMGTQIIPLQADVADFQALSKALLHLRKTLGGIPIKGVFHGAVVLADHMLVNMTDEDFAMATRPKILGAWNLHQLTEKDPLDYFVMHSSIVSIFGNMGQTNYGAGNAFLDCLAQYRRLCGLPGQAINWSVLNIGIIEGNEAVKKKMMSMGYLPLQITDIMKCFEFALSFNTVQVAFGDFHWSKIKHNLHGYEPVHIRGRFQDFINIPEESASQGTSSSHTGSSLDEIMTEVAANVLTLEAEQVKGDMSLLELGLDSIQAITIQRHLKEKTGVLVPVTRLIDQKTTLSQISYYIDKSIRQRHVIITPEKNELEPVQPKINIKATEDQVERFHRTLDNSKGVASNIYTIFQLHRNDTTAEYWEESLRILMKKHPMLRAIFRHATEDIYDVTFDIHQEFKPDIRCLEGVTNDADMIAEIKKVSEIPFDLRKEYPIRIFLYMIDGKVNFVCCVVHHISCDFFSLTTLLRDLRQIMLPSLTADETERFEFFDYLKRRGELLKSQGKILKKFWAGVFRSSLDFLPGRYSLMIQVPKSSPAYQTKWSIETADLTQLNSFARTSGLTLFQIVTAVYVILLKIYSKSNDVLITYPVDMRIHVPVSHDAVGYFINIVPLRVRFRGMTASINDFLKEVGNMINSGTDHSLYPLTKIEQCVRIDGIEKPPCLTQHTITMEDHSAFKEIGQYDKIDGIKNIGGGNAQIRQMTLIEIIKSTEMDTMLFKCSFNESYFERDDAIRFCDDYKHLMKMCVRNPYMTLADLISKFQSE